jgi:hypothetical protein
MVVGHLAGVVFCVVFWLLVFGAGAWLAAR